MCDGDALCVAIDPGEDFLGITFRLYEKIFSGVECVAGA